MSTGKIQSGTTSLISLADGDSGVTHYGYVVKDPTTKTCRLIVVARSSSNMSTSTILAIVRSGFRPKADSSLFGAITSADGKMNAFFGTVKTDGSIIQNAGSTIREVFLTGEYLYE